MDIMSPDKAKKAPEQELQEAWEMHALSGKGNPRFLQSKKFRFANSVERPELMRYAKRSPTISQFPTRPAKPMCSRFLRRSRRRG